MPIVYWRHANDNERTPNKKHDPRATGKGRHNARKMARKMARKGGPPTIIYVSPMRRCRDTVRSMIEGLERDKHPAPELVIDENLSRYFCSREQKRPEVRKSTGEVPITETWSQFRARVKKRAQFLWKTHGGENGGVAWCVTHALVLKQLAIFHREKIPGWLDFLFNFAPDASSGSRRRNAEGRGKALVACDDANKALAKRRSRKRDRRRKHSCQACKTAVDRKPKKKRHMP